MRRAGLIAAYSLRSVLASRAGWAFAVFTAASAVFVVDSIVGPVEALEDWLDAGAVASGADAGLLAAVAESQHLTGLVTWVTDGDPVRAEFLLHEQPAVLTGILLVLLMLTPVLVALGSFDQTAGDIGSRWMRFVLFRSERHSVFLGRLVASASLLVVLFALLVLTLTVYLDWRLGLYPRAALFGWGFQGYLALVALALPHVALCGWVSAANRSSLRALTACLLAVAVPIALLGVSAAQLELPGWLVALHPWGWKYQLLDPAPASRALAFLAMAGFTALLTAAGATTFQRRDV